MENSSALEVLTGLKEQLRDFFDVETDENGNTLSEFLHFPIGTNDSVVYLHFASLVPVGFSTSNLFYDF